LQRLAARIDVARKSAAAPAVTVREGEEKS